MIENFSRFLVVGVGSTFINFIFFYICQLSEFKIFVSSLIGYLAGVLNSYYWGSKWVHFKVYELEILSFTKFVLLYGINGIIVSFIIQEVQLSYELDYRICWLFGTSYGVVANFAGQKLLIFNKS